MRTLLALACLLALSLGIEAKNVDLSTVPGRTGVQLTIYNSEDITLVKETRSLTFKMGTNRLQFSWANTLIDPTSVNFRPLEHAEDIEVADTVFPGQKPEHLIWNVESKFEGEAKVEVTYFTSGLTWSMDYVSIVNPDESLMRFRGYVRVFNNSGEEYEHAEIRLIVGTINLVEKIAELARRRGMEPPAPGTAVYRDSAKEALGESFEAAQDANLAPRQQGAGIVKEGLSEYFMFSVDGAETVPNGWSKRMQAVAADDAKFDIVYRMRAHQYGPRPVRFFLWRNDAEHKLGESPLPDGRVNVFRENGSDGLSFLGQQAIRYVPIKAEIEVNLGPDDLVVYETRQVSTERLNFHFVDEPEYVDGWDDKTVWVDTIRNYRTKPIQFELRRIWEGDVEYKSGTPTTLFDYQTAETKFAIDARSKVEYPVTAMRHEGSNAKQSRIQIVR